VFFWELVHWLVLEYTILYRKSSVSKFLRILTALVKRLMNGENE
jgi:hypothetical protein